MRILFICAWLPLWKLILSVCFLDWARENSFHLRKLTFFLFVISESIFCQQWIILLSKTKIWQRSLLRFILLNHRHQFFSPVNHEAYIFAQVNLKNITIAKKKKKMNRETWIISLIQLQTFLSLWVQPIRLTWLRGSLFESKKHSSLWFSPTNFLFWKTKKKQKRFRYTGIYI